MQDDFEIELSRRMQEFSISPQPEIWQQVEAALPEKKRRFALWWWLPLVMIGVGLGVWWFGNHQQEKPATSTAQQEKHIQKSKPISIKNRDTSNTLINSTTETKATIITPAIPDTNTQENATTDNNFNHSTIIQNKTLASRHKEVKSKSTTTQKRSNTFSRKTLLAKQVKAKSNVESLAEVDDIIKEKIALQSSTGKAELTIEQVDSTHIDSALVVQSNDTATAKKIASIQKDSSEKKEVAAQKKTDRKPITKKAIWLADIVMGTSWLKGTSNLDKSVARAYDNFYNANPSTGVGSGIGSGSTPARFTKPSTGFSFGLGVLRRQELSKYISWQLALHYQYLSASQLIGQRSNIPISYAIDSTSVSAYRTGSSQAYRNVVHQLQLSPSIVYSINPTAHLPVSISAGVSIAYNFSSNLLLHDYGNSIYLRSRSAMAKMQYGTYLGIDFLLHKRIPVGLIYQYSFSNVAGADLGSDYRWRQLQLHIAIPFSKK